MITQLVQRVKSLDFMTPPVQLNIGGKVGVQTLFGVAMTVCYSASVIVFSYVFLLSFISTESPTVTSETAQSDINPTIDLVKASMFPVIYVSMSNLYNIPPAQVPSFFTMFYTKIRLYQQTAPNGTVTLNVFYQQMKVIPCSTALQNETIAATYQPFNSSPFFRDYAKLFGFCVQFNETESYISGAGQQTTADITALQFYPCSLANTSLCAPLQQLRAIGILVTLPQPSLNLSNYEDPIKFSLSADNLFFINEGATQKYYEKFMITEIYDESRYFFQQTLRTNITSIEKVVANSKGRDATQLSCSLASFSTCTPYLEFQFISGASKTKYYRSYRTISQLLSQIGGINNMTLIIFVYINLIYNYYAKKILLVDRVFKFFKEAKTVDGNPPKEPEPNDSFQKIGDQSSFDKPKTTLINPLENLDKRTLKMLKEEAYEVIMKNLDVITIVREINNLKVLTHLLFKNYQQKLMPIISLNIQCKQDRAKRKLKEITGVRGGRKKTQIGNLQDMADYDGFENDDGGKITVEAAFKQLCREVDAATEIAEDKQSLEQKVDMFCCKNLEDAHARKIEHSLSVSPVDVRRFSVISPKNKIQRPVLKDKDNNTRKSLFDASQAGNPPEDSPSTKIAPQASSIINPSKTIEMPEHSPGLKKTGTVTVLQRNPTVIGGNENGTGTGNGTVKPKIIEDHTWKLDSTSNKDIIVSDVNDKK